MFFRFVWSYWNGNGGVCPLRTASAIRCCLVVLPSFLVLVSCFIALFMVALTFARLVVCDCHFTFFRPIFFLILYLLYWMVLEFQQGLSSRISKKLRSVVDEGAWPVMQHGEDLLLWPIKRTSSPYGETDSERMRPVFIGRHRRQRWPLPNFTVASRISSSLTPSAAGIEPLRADDVPIIRECSRTRIGVHENVYRSHHPIKSVELLLKSWKESTARSQPNIRGAVTARVSANKHCRNMVSQVESSLLITSAGKGYPFLNVFIKSEAKFMEVHGQLVERRVVFSENVRWTKAIDFHGPNRLLATEANRNDAEGKDWVPTDDDAIGRRGVQLEQPTTRSGVSSLTRPMALGGTLNPFLGWLQWWNTEFTSWRKGFYVRSMSSSHQLMTCLFFTHYLLSSRPNQVPRFPVHFQDPCFLILYSRLNFLNFLISRVNGQLSFPANDISLMFVLSLSFLFLEFLKSGHSHIFQIWSSNFLFNDI